GTVWFGVACGGVLVQQHPELRTECCHFAGDREAVRQATVAHAIDMLLNTLSIP
ncbi:MAG: hypothetical protein HKN70_11895, partial [Gammaproteobacteria bacterium]|nr:hypothetical protein [Gammaproteobacteria bacterium]